MTFPQTLIRYTSVVLLSASACLGASVYGMFTSLETGTNQLGAIDLTTGAFQAIGPGSEGATGLAQGPNGSLLTLGFTGNLDAINPNTGVSSTIGFTGLGDCSTPSSPCPPNSANTIGGVGGVIVATDLANNLYRVNTATGAATLIGKTAIPGLPFIPLSNNPDGTFNAYGESLFEANGKLYATFGAFTVDPTTFTIKTVLIPGALYQVDINTGATTVIGPTDLTFAAAAQVNGTVYAFIQSPSQIGILDLTNGQTGFVTDFDSSAGILTGTVPTPEPFSFALAGLGICAIAVYKLRRFRA